MSGLSSIKIGDLAANAPASKVSQVRARDIAVIGMAATYPMAPDKDRFWENLRTARECVTTFPQARSKDVEPFFSYLFRDSDLELKYTRGAYLEEIAHFDHRFFRITPREACLMDPNHRLFLRCAMEALEDAGYGGTRLMGSRTGVFVGFCPDMRDANYKDVIMKTDRTLIPIAVPANLSAILPSRISYFMDFRGPTMCVDAACSSSLVAVHLACSSIRTGDSDLAIAGGIKLNLFPLDMDVKVGIESEDGYARPFDERASGTGVGEGVGAVLLKPLHRALADNDHIYAVIKGSAVNQDGRSMGITAPNPAAQTEVMVRAWEDAGIDPGTLEWIEAHGTATRIGDPIELSSISNALRKYSARTQFCAVTSLKGNINHLFEAASIASFIKAVMCLERGEIPPSMRFESPNPAFDFVSSPIYVNDRLKPWPRVQRPRQCGVNSFGMSGTNCHVVLEEAPLPAAESIPESKPFLFTLSAKQPASLREMVERYCTALSKGNLTLRDVCFTASTGRGHYECRLALLVDSMAQLRAQLDRCKQDGLGHPDGQHIFYAENKSPPRKDRAPQNPAEAEALEALEKLDAAASARVKNFADAPRQPALKELAELYVQGATVDWDALFKNECARRVSLPTYAFETTRVAYDPPPEVLETYVQHTRLHHGIQWIKEALVQETKPAGKVLLLRDESPSPRVGELRQALHNQGLEVLEHTVTSAVHAQQVLSAIPLREVSYVIHMQNHGRARVQDAHGVEEAQNLGFRSLYHWLGCCAAEKDARFNLAIVIDNAYQVDGSEGELKPENAIVAGLGLVQDKELGEGRHCLAVDVDEHTPMDVVVQELGAKPGNYFRAYRHGTRYVQQFGPTTLADPEPLPLREDGVYLITGGTGGLGLAVAEHLSRQARIKLALLSRNGMPEPSTWPRIITAGVDPRLITRIQYAQRIIANGSTVEFPVADTADEPGLKGVIAELRTRHGRINGIMHCAGAPSAISLQEGGDKEFAKVVTPKTTGTVLLDELTRADKPDFMVLFSSVATVFPALGQSYYTAANAFLDAFAQARNRTHGYTCAINWVAWHDVGMAFDSGAAVDTIVKAIAPQDAVMAMQQAMDGRLTNVMIGALNYRGDMFPLIRGYPMTLEASILARLNERGSHRSSSLQPSSARCQARLTGRPDGQYSVTEQSLASIWGEVLGFEEIDVTANFYDLGGDSILAMRSLNAIRDRFALEIKLTELIQCQTVQDLAKALDARKAVNDGSQDTGIPVAPDADAYPLSFQQRRLLASIGNRTQDTTYNNPYMYRVEGELDVARFEAAVATLIDMHPALRTSFVDVNGITMQRVVSHATCKVTHLESKEDQVPPLARSLVQPMDLSVAPLLRVALIRVSPKLHYAFFDAHHLVSDGASLTLLIEGLSRIYSGGTATAPAIRHVDHSVWQQSAEPSAFVKEQCSYWLSQYNTPIASLSMPTDFPRGQPVDSKGNRHPFVIDETLKTALEGLAKQQGISLFTALAAGYGVLLAKYANQHPVVVPIPVSGRTHSQLERVVGMFVNTLPLLLDPAPELPIKEYLVRAGAAVTDALTHQDVTLEQWIHHVDPQTAKALSLQTAFAFQNQPPRLLSVSSVTMHPCPVETGTSVFDFNMEASEYGDKIYGAILYRVQLFKPETIQRMAGDYLSILQSMATLPSTHIKDIAMATVSSKPVSQPQLTNVEFDF